MLVSAVPRPAGSSESLLVAAGFVSGLSRAHSLAGRPARIKHQAEPQIHKESHTPRY
jgi:hypothetical protein